MFELYGITRHHTVDTCGLPKLPKTSEDDIFCKTLVAKFLTYNAAWDYVQKSMLSTYKTICFGKCDKQFRQKSLLPNVAGTHSACSLDRVICLRHLFLF